MLSIDTVLLRKKGRKKMKKRKILYLFPIAALFLSGCTFQEGFATAKQWVGQNVYFPFRDWIVGLTKDEKEEVKEEEKQSEQTTPSGDQGSEQSSGSEGQGQTPGGSEGGSGEQGQGGGGSGEQGQSSGGSGEQGQGGGQVTPPEVVPGDGTAEHPYSVSEARAVAEETATEETYIKGFIYKIDSFNSTYSSITYWISETGLGKTSAKDGVQIYSGKGIGGAAFASVADLSLGDSVVVKGQLKLFGGNTVELDKNNELVSRTSSVVESVAISGTPQTEYYAGVAYNHDGLSAIATYENGATVDVSAESTCAWAISKETAELNDEPISINATFGGHTSDPVVVTVTVVQPADDTYYPATMTKGTSAYDDGTVNDEPCIKIGTSSKGGDMTITVGAGATQLRLYAVAWKGVTGLSLNITAPTGVTTDPTSIALTADDGATASSPFTIANVESYLFTISLSGVSAETTLTFTTSAAKRCIVWGAEYRK